MRAGAPCARELFEKYLSPSPIFAQVPCTKAFQPIPCPLETPVNPYLLGLSASVVKVKDNFQKLFLYV